MSWRDAMAAVSNNILPNLKFDQEHEIGAYEASPDMPLQLLLFFNVYLFPFWLATVGFFLYVKCLGNLTKFLSVGVVLMTTVIESFRLYLGYIGNLSEQIPELAGFWMLSILLQLPMLTFLLTNPYLHSCPQELILNGVMWILLVSQLWTGFFALRKASSRAKEYYAIKSSMKEESSRSQVESDDQDKQKRE